MRHATLGAVSGEDSGETRFSVEYPEFSETQILPEILLYALL